MTAPYGPWPPYGPPPAPPRRGGRRWVIVAVAVVVLSVAGGATGYVLYHQNSDPTKIEALINDFSDAVTNGNPQTIAGFMCREEAQTYLDAVEEFGGELANPQNPAFEIGDITVRGDAASAVLKFQGSEGQTIYFRKEDGTWTVCAPAQSQM